MPSAGDVQKPRCRWHPCGKQVWGGYSRACERWGRGGSGGGGAAVREGARVYLQWWARSGLMLQHLGHLYTTCPGFSCKLSMNSLVAFPLGTAPCQKEERRQAWARGSSSSDAPRWRRSLGSSNCTHGQDVLTPATCVVRIMPTPMDAYGQRIFLRESK